ncbi:NRDE family protein, partial [Alcanivorax sp. UBA3183]
RAKQHLANAITADCSTEQLMEVVDDHFQPPDSELPDTGVGLDLERLVAPVFIQSPTYGTRASSVVELHRDRDPIMLEQGWLPDGSASGSLQRS